MTQSAWQTPPTFAAGDVLSATKLNVLLTDLDVLQGMEYSPEYPIETDQYPVQNNGVNPIYEGWLVKTGSVNGYAPPDRMYYSFDDDSYYDIYYGSEIDVDAKNAAVRIARRVQNDGFAVLPGIYEAWRPYKVAIHSSSNKPDNWRVNYLYLGNGNAPVPPSTPAFTDGDASAASDLSAITEGLNKLYSCLYQPQICVRGDGEGAGEIGGSGVFEATWKEHREWSIQHRHNSVYVHVRLRRGRGIGSPSVDWTAARLQYYGSGLPAAGVTVWQDQIQSGPSTTPPPETKTINGIINMQDAGSLVFGTWYTVRFEYAVLPNQPGNVPGDNPIADNANGGIRFYQWCEATNGTPSGWAQGNRWTHGNYGRASTGSAPTPRLDTLATNVDILDARRRWVNPVARESMTFGSEEKDQAKARKWYGIRKWRWLAYQSIDADTEAVLYWTDGSNTSGWQAVTLDTKNAGAFYDLDSSPVLPGMAFYVTGTKYAIQTPQPYP